LTVCVDKRRAADVFTPPEQAACSVAGCYVNCGYDGPAAYNCNGPASVDHPHQLLIDDTADKLAVMYALFYYTFAFSAKYSR